MPPTKSQILADRQANLNAALLDPNIIDKRHLLAQLAEVESVIGTNPSNGGISPSDIAAGVDESADIDLIKGLLTDIKLELVNSKSIADILIQDSGATPRYFIRQDVVDQTTGTTTTTILNLDGSTPNPVPVLPLMPIKAGATNQVVENLYITTANGTGYAIGDSLSNVRVLDGGTGNLVASLWYNLTSGSAIASSPPIAELKGYEDKVEELLVQLVDASAQGVSSIGDVADISLPFSSDGEENPATVKALIRQQLFFLRNLANQFQYTNQSARDGSPSTIKSVLGDLSQDLLEILGSASDVSVSTGITNIPSNIKSLLRYIAISIESLTTRIKNTVPTVVVDAPSSVLFFGNNISDVTPDKGISYQVEFVVTAITGTIPTLNVTIQESNSESLEWETVYTFPPITAIGSFKSALLPSTGNKIRYFQSVVGSASALFTRHINRIESNQPVDFTVRTKRSGSFNLPNTGFDIPLYGRTRRVVSTNRTANLYFWQFHDSATALVTGAVPLAAEVYQMPANSTVPFTVADLGEHGTVFGVNPRLALSTTFATYTPVSAVAADSISIFVERL